MESIQRVKERIASIKSTRQIMQSMRLVSTAKVQRARAKMEANRSFSEEIARILRLAVGNADLKNHRFMRENTDALESKSAVIVLSADRGLCGGYNVNVCRQANTLIKGLGGVKVITVGQKARDYFRRRMPDSLAGSHIGISETPIFHSAEEVSADALEWYENGEVDAVYLVYTEFKNILTQNPVAKKILPLEPEDGEEPVETYVNYEPEIGAFLSHLVPFYMYSTVYGAMLESSACEQSARLSSMTSAVKNSDDIVEQLILQLNRTRQASITQELNEISGGVRALEKKQG